MASTPSHAQVSFDILNVEKSYGNSFLAYIGRIPVETSGEIRIYPLPHMYVVKDLVPDLTQCYKQYKSIKPYLQRDTKTPDVSFLLAAA